jgi:putative transposase
MFATLDPATLPGAQDEELAEQSARGRLARVQGPRPGQLPLGHRRAIRTTNPLERLFGEERRRTMIIPHTFGERAVLKLMYAALIRAAEHWRGIRITEFERRQLKAVRDEIDNEFSARTTPTTKTTLTASPTRLSSKNRT